MAEEKVANDTYENLVTSKIAEPLGMHDTRITLSPAEQANLAHDKGAASITTGGGSLGAGALRSNARDMALFLAANIDPASTDLASILELTQQQQSKGPSPTVVMGLGWLIAKPGTTSELFNKDGSTIGYRSYIAFSKNSRTGFAILCKSDEAFDKLPGQLEQALDLTQAPSDRDQ